jgi:hypothetical protein
LYCGRAAIVGVLLQQLLVEPFVRLHTLLCTCHL